MDVRPHSFLSDLAAVLYDTPAEIERESQEVAIVKRLESMLETATSSQIFRHGPFIDAHLLPHLSGRNLLAVARLMELRAPAAIENMPRLREKRERLKRGWDLAQVLSPRALANMIAALELEAASAAAGAPG
jgi:hypothetical protein